MKVVFYISIAYSNWGDTYKLFGVQCMRGRMSVGVQIGIVYIMPTIERMYIVYKLFGVQGRGLYVSWCLLELKSLNVKFAVKG